MTRAQLEHLADAADRDNVTLLDDDPRAPGVARVTLRAVLIELGLAGLADRAELLLSELVTNSVRHTRGPASMRLQCFHPVLRVIVRDRSPKMPPLPRAGALAAALTPSDPDPDPDGECGRGLLIFDALADRWGGEALGEYPNGPGGKTLWFEPALPDPRPTAARRPLSPPDGDASYRNRAQGGILRFRRGKEQGWRRRTVLGRTSLAM